MATYDTIVFDLGGVLIDWNPRYLYRKIFATEAEMERFLAEVCTLSWNHEQDAGRTLAAATELLVGQHPEWEPQIRAFYDRWEEMLGGPIHGTVELLETLRDSGQYRLYALTNWSGETFPIARQHYDFLNIFEGIVVSGDEKVAKPEARIYEILLERYQIDPSRTIYIDDSLPNVEGAQAAGMEAIHFYAPMQLREALAERL
ncbi:MAG: HAD family phosphatase [Bacteroidetes bacterium]|nr:MAG: HAD family phosphatase [Bacteroidota bacterium]